MAHGDVAADGAAIGRGARASQLEGLDNPLAVADEAQEVNQRSDPFTDGSESVALKREGVEGESEARGDSSRRPVHARDGLGGRRSLARTQLGRR